jgi:hypothetical protein
LFFYPAIDEEKLKKQTSPIKRNNELGTFEEVLAKHIFLMEQAYPALFDKKNGLKDQLISKFVGKAVTAGNWQRILTTEKQDVAALTLAVRDKLSKLESFKDNHDYKESSQHNASSSDDEVEKLPIKSSIPLDQEMSQTAQQQTQNTK